MQTQPEQQESVKVGKKTLNKGSKLLLVLVVVIGASTLGYGVYSIQQSFLSPFKLAGLGSLSSEFLIQTQASKDQAIEELKTKDTDRDTLTDYDEINLYGTSPYIADTDSDGIPDDIEVSKGTDPNCAEGEDCFGIRLVTPDTRISDLFPQFSTSTISLMDKTVQDFRQTLLDQGFDAEKLAQIDDRTLIIVLEDSLKLQDEEAVTTATSTPETESVDFDQVRLLLVDMGVPKDEVYSMSNQDIENFLKTLE